MDEFKRDHAGKTYPHTLEMPKESLFRAPASKNFNTYLDVGEIRIRFYQFDTMESQYRNALARGFMSEGQWTNLSKLLKKHSVEDETSRPSTAKYVLRVAITHHPVINRGWHSSSLAGRKRIAKQLGDLGFSLILSGHEHDPRCVESEDLIQLVCGSSTQASRRKRSRTWNVFSFTHLMGK
ncbi:MAG TPA: metallophosphoesterase family protein [Nitrospiraceae bacterium]|nr:metallophosphoesterase family protein [Nitrospiraceae bacterium]